jgi:mycothiol synthase
VRPADPFTSRPAAPTDAAEVAELMMAFDRAHLQDPDVIDSSEVGGWWSRRELDRDTLVLRDAASRLVAHGMLWSEGDEILELDAFVHPDYTGHGLGSFLIDWAEEEARGRGCSLLRTNALAADPAARTLIEDRGFALVRHFYRMLADLDASPPAPVWPEGFSVSTFAPGEEELLRAVTEEAFAEHWGHVDRDADDWRRTVFEQDWWDPSLVYLVRAGDEVVAAEINALRFGVGWVGTIGVRKPWRGHGIGRALLLAAFGEFYRRGEHRIGLGVDAGNETGATHLYESLGMRAAWQADVYERRM